MFSFVYVLKSEGTFTVRSNSLDEALQTRKLVRSGAQVSELVYISVIYDEALLAREQLGMRGYAKG